MNHKNGNNKLHSENNCRLNLHDIYNMQAREHPLNWIVDCWRSQTVSKRAMEIFSRELECWLMCVEKTRLCFARFVCVLQLGRLPISAQVNQRIFRVSRCCLFFFRCRIRRSLSEVGMLMSWVVGRKREVLKVNVDLWNCRHEFGWCVMFQPERERGGSGVELIENVLD